MLLRSRRFLLILVVILGTSAFLAHRKDAFSTVSRARFSGFRAGKGKGWEGVKYFFVFGDSYSATGFDITDDRPLPSPENPLGNPPFPGHTWAVGPNWVSHLTSTFNRSLILTYNFAYGGATISDDLVPSTSPIEIPSLATQIRHQFLPRTGTWTPTQRTAENSIYFLWVGINDVIRGPGEVLSHQMAPAGPTEGGQRGGTVDTWKLLVDLMHQEVDRYMSLLDQLFHAASARRFIIMSVPPIDRSPAILQNPDAARKTVKALVSVFNSLLEQRVEAWKMAKRGAEVEWYDTGRLFHDIMDRPGKWGFKNATGACPVYYVEKPNEVDVFDKRCGAPVDEYVWRDVLHPGTKLNYWLAKEMSAVVADTRKP